MSINRTKLNVFNNLKYGDRISMYHNGYLVHGYVSSLHFDPADGRKAEITLEVLLEVLPEPKYNNIGQSCIIGNNTVTLFPEDADLIVSAAPASIADVLQHTSEKDTDSLKTDFLKTDFWFNNIYTISKKYKTNSETEFWASPKTVEILRKKSKIQTANSFVHLEYSGYSIDLLVSEDVPDEQLLLTYDFPSSTDIKNLVKTTGKLFNLNDGKKIEKTLSMRERILAISDKTQYEEIWLNITDYSKLSYELISTEYKLDHEILAGGHYASIGTKIIHVGSFVPAGKIFLSDDYSKVLAETDFNAHQHRLIDIDKLQTMSDIIDAADLIEVQEEKRNCATLSSSTVSLTSSCGNSSTITLTPNSAACSTFSNVTFTDSSAAILNPAPMWNAFGKFVDGLTHIAEILNHKMSEPMQTKDEKKLTTIYSRAFDAGMTGVRHVWANKQECIREFSQTTCEGSFIISNGFTDKTIHPVDSMPPGFVFFSSSAKEPTEKEFKAQPAYILSIERGSYQSVSETEQNFNKAREEYSSIKKSIDESTELAKKALNDTIQKIESRGLQASLLVNDGYMTVAKPHSETYNEAVNKLDELFKEALRIKAEKAEKDKPIDSAIANITVDPATLANYARYDRLIKDGEILFGKKLSAKEFDDILNLTLYDARLKSGLKDDIACLSYPNDPQDKREACAVAGYASYSLDAIIGAFAASGMEKTEAGRAQLFTWLDKRWAVFNHLIAVAGERGIDYVEDIAINNRNAFRQIFTLPGIYSSFSEEEQKEEAAKIQKASEMKLSEQFSLQKEVEKKMSEEAPLAEDYEEKVMTKSLVEDVTDTYDKAKWRVASRQVNRRLRDAIVLAVNQLGHEKAEVKLLEKFLKTQLGEGFLALGVGLIGSRIGFLSDNPKAMQLCEESKVEGMAVVGDDLIEMVASKIGPLIMGALSSSLDSLPEVRIEVKEKPKKVRIKAPKKVSEDDEEADDEAAEAEAKPAKRATVDAR